MTLPPPSPTPRVATAASQHAAPTFTPAPTPTPVIYVVKSGDTLLVHRHRIRHDRRRDSAGQRHHQPSVAANRSRADHSARPGGVEAAKQLLPTPTPFAAQVQGLAFYETSVGSLRCLGEVANPNTRALENVQVRIVLKDAAGQMLVEGRPFTMLDVIPPAGNHPLSCCSRRRPSVTPPSKQPLSAPSHRTSQAGVTPSSKSPASRAAQTGCSFASSARCAMQRQTGRQRQSHRHGV